MTATGKLRNMLCIAVAAAFPGCAMVSGPAPAPVYPEPSRASSFAGAPPVSLETPYTNEDLRRNFLSIALRAEAADDVDAAGEIAIAKWDGPVRYLLDGASPSDHASVARLASKLRRITGLDIASADNTTPPNMVLRFVAPYERRIAVERLGRAGALGPHVARMAMRWRDGGSEKCLGLIAVDPLSGAIGASEILIKDELPPHLREACIIEEITQSLGLMNDEPTARPSIFNDDQRYLALTSHDEILLRVLYDPRLRPGMRRREVEPMLPVIIQALRPADNGAI